MGSSTLRAGRYAVIDVETTGLHPANDAVVEVACLRVEHGAVTDRFVSLVHPGRLIPPIASSVHGIYDVDVHGAPPLEALRTTLLTLTAGATVVAHNARFDLGFLPFLSSRRCLCTMRLAMHVVDAPSYRNQALREMLGAVIPAGAGPAHRAGSDAEVTAAILAILLERYEAGPFPQHIDGLIDTIARPARLGRFAFGIHRGKPVAHVPASYLRWIVAEGFYDWPDVRATARRELDRRARRSAVATAG